MEQSSSWTASNSMCVTNSLSPMEFDVFQAAWTQACVFESNPRRGWMSAFFLRAFVILHI